MMKQILPLQLPLIIAPLISECQRSSNKITSIVSKNLRKNREIHREGVQLIDNGIKKIRRAHTMSARTNRNCNLYAFLLDSHVTSRKPAR